MKHLSVIFLLSMMLAGCNTVAGVGKDVERAGEAVQDAAKKK
jgi:predicted small secreted protein